MENQPRWWERENLNWRDLERLMQEGNFRKISEISPENSEQSKYIKVGDKIALLLSNGLVGYYTITALKDIDGTCIVGRDETGIQVKGETFALDSSFSWCQDRGYKKLEKFPWE